MTNKIMVGATLMALIGLGMIYFYINHIIHKNERLERQEAINNAKIDNRVKQDEVADKIKDRFIKQTEWEEEANEEVNNVIKQNDSDDDYSITATDSNSSK